ncbi:MAG: SRPBCC family protein [Pseudoxanthomonas suwonensis]|nr:SRPBCC family protein [Pseudoxanthomonas suwonensis]
MFKKIVFILLLLIGLLLVVAWTRPDTYTVERSGHAPAPPAQVFAMVGDFRNWPRWSPWEQLDPDMQRVFSVPQGNVGASYDWIGDDQAGKGRMRILDAEPDRRLSVSLDFIEPMASSNRMDFAFLPEAGGTQVTWRMEGQHSFPTKVMSVFTSFDRLIGRDFEQGLQNLAREAHAPLNAETRAVE